VPEITQGKVNERPFARLVYTLAARRFNGDLTVTEGHLHFIVGWKDGLVVSARSPLPEDSIGKIAVASGLLNEAQLHDITRRAALRRISASEALLQIGNLSSAQLSQLKQRVFARQAERIFGFEKATFTLRATSQLTQKPHTLPLDPRWLILHGLRHHYPLDRLQREIKAMLNRHFALRTSISLRPFGFSKEESTILDQICEDTHTALNLVAKLSKSHSQKSILVVVYALAATNCLDFIEPSQHGVIPESSQRPPDRRYQSAITPLPIHDLIRTKLRLVQTGGNHFALLGVSPTANETQIKSAYFTLAKQLHPDRVAALELKGIEKNAQLLFSHINQAFAVLSKPQKREAYLRSLSRPSSDKELLERVVAAEEQFQQGSISLKNERFTDAVAYLSKAVELNPNEGEHYALLGWAEWCVAPNKNEAVRQVKKRFSQAIALSPKCKAAFLYRGRIAIHLKKYPTAIECLKKVLELDPGNHEAELELRVLYSRMPKKEMGFLGRKKK